MIKLHTKIKVITDFLMKRDVQSVMQEVTRNLGNVVGDQRLRRTMKWEARTNNPVRRRNAETTVRAEETMARVEAADEVIPFVNRRYRNWRKQARAGCRTAPVSRWLRSWPSAASADGRRTSAPRTFLRISSADSTRFADCVILKTDNWP